MTEAHDAHEAPEHEPEHEHEHDEHEHEHLSWEDALQAERQAAAHYYLHRFDWRGEPIPDGFSGPRHYPIDAAWALQARLDTTAPGTGDPIQLATSTGQLRDMAIAGQLVFTAPDGGERRLSAYRSARRGADDPLFVPFQDATSGTETYGAGRYLDVWVDEDGTAQLDFNRAYSPSCAYSPRYDCPYPPRGNRLDIPVRAGEMVPVEGH